MKKLFLILAISISGIVVKAQSPVAEPDTLQNPVNQGDPELKQIPADMNYVDERVRITADQLPAAVRDSLKMLEPTGWEKSVVYRDKKENIFIVEVREGGEEKTYRFNKQGKKLKNLDEKKD